MLKRAGFTLVELLLVVVILTVLAGMILPRLAGRREEAMVGATRADIYANIPMALDLYELDNGSYPTTEQGLEALLREPTPTPPNWKGPYLKKRPIDPWGNPYQYKSPGEQNKDYDLYSFGKDGVEGGDDITNWQEEEPEE